MALRLFVQLIALCTHASAGWCWKCIGLESESLSSEIRKWKWQHWLCGFAATCTDVQLGALCTHTLLNTMIDLWHLFYSSSKKQETKITQTKRHKKIKGQKHASQYSNDWSLASVLLPQQKAGNKNSTQTNKRTKTRFSIQQWLISGICTSPATDKKKKPST